MVELAVVHAQQRPTPRQNPFAAALSVPVEELPVTVDKGESVPRQVFQPAHGYSLSLPKIQKGN